MAAISFDNSSSQTVGNGTISFSHTIASLSDLFCCFGSGVSIVGTPTYNGVNGTQLTTVATNGNEYIYFWATPTAGAHTVSASFGAGNSAAGACISLTGDNGKDAVGTGAGSGATSTVNVVVNTVNEWTVDCTWVDSSLSAPMTANTGQTLKVSANDTVNAQAIGFGIKGPYGATGTQTLGDAGLGANSWDNLAVSVKVAPVTSGVINFPPGAGTVTFPPGPGTVTFR